MNQRRRNKSNKSEQKNTKNIIRCRSRMSPVFESDTCPKFINKRSESVDKMCMNCKHSF